MAKCRWIHRVERWFDGEDSTAAVSEHVRACATCKDHVETLRAMRSAISEEAKHEAIGDAQFPAFMAGIRDQVSAPRGRVAGLWAYASLTAAALVVALSAFVIFSGGPQDVDASVVESATSDIEGAEVDVYSSENGTATVWVNLTGRDVW